MTTELLRNSERPKVAAQKAGQWPNRRAHQVPEARHGAVLMIALAIVVASSCGDSSSDSKPSSPTSQSDTEDTDAGNGTNPPDREADGDAPDTDGNNSTGGTTDSSGEGCQAGQVRCGSECVEAFTPDLTTLSTRVFSRSCGLGSCHGPASPKEGLSLHDVAAILGAVGKPSKQRPELHVIHAGDPNSSYLLNKIKGIGMAETDSSGNGPSRRMPPSTPLCEPKIAAIEAWIRSGAHE